MPAGVHLVVERTRTTLHELNMQALDLQLGHTDGARWRELAAIRACIGTVTDARLREAARQLLMALGHDETQRAVWRYAWTWWRESATHWLHAHQADRLSPAWCRAHVAGAPRVPAGGAVLVSAHHFNQRLGWVRLSEDIDRLGLVSEFGCANATSPGLNSAKVHEVAARQQLGRLYQRTFGGRMFCPGLGLRPALVLLRDGGSVIVGPDGQMGQRPAHLLGRSFPLGPGALWLARRADVPIVPFAVAPAGKSWRLWCGDPVEPVEGAVERALEACIRQAPANWMLVTEWSHSPAGYAD